MSPWHALQLGIHRIIVSCYQASDWGSKQKATITDFVKVLPSHMQTRVERKLPYASWNNAPVLHTAMQPAGGAFTCTVSMKS